LKYQKLSDLVSAIGLPKEKLCTYCWDGVEVCSTCPSRVADVEKLPVHPE
jgi:glutamine phosphoribosylpyrophosphate amidotransferase